MTAKMRSVSALPSDTRRWVSHQVTLGGTTVPAAFEETSSCRRRAVTLLAYLLLGIAVALAVLVLGMAMTQPAGAAPVEQRAEYRDWALHWREQAVRVRARALKHTRALAIKPPRAVPKMQRFIDPATGEEFVDWYDYGWALKHQTKSWREYAIPRWHERIFTPGGSGVQRWAAMLRWCGLPEGWMWRSLAIMRGESGGNPLCVYCGHYGLYQFTSGWWAGRWDWRSPYHQCRVFVRAVKAGGWHHWRATDPCR